MAESYLSFENVTKRFGDVAVVSETSFGIGRNSFVVFLGPSPASSAWTEISSPIRTGGAAWCFNPIRRSRG